MTVACFRDNGVMFLWVDAGDGVRARCDNSVMFLWVDAGDGVQRCDEHPLMPDKIFGCTRFVSESTDDALQTRDHGPHIVEQLSGSFIEGASSSDLGSLHGTPVSSTCSIPVFGLCPRPGRTSTRADASGTPAEDTRDARTAAACGATTSQKKQRMSRSKRLQTKRVLTKLTEQARTAPHLPIEIPYCLSDSMSEQALRTVRRDLERLRSQSDADADAARRGDA